MKASKVVFLVFLIIIPLFVVRTQPVKASEPVENTWTTKADMPTTVSNIQAVALNGKIYVVGAYTDRYDYRNNTLYEYDPAWDTWAIRKPMSSAILSFALAACKGKIYVMGGVTFTNFTSGAHIHLLSNMVYDPLADAWETKASMPTNRSQMEANVVNGKIFVIGGRISDESTVSLNEVYDPSTDSWSTRAPIPYPVTSYASAVVDNRIYVIEGQDEYHDPMNPGFNQIYDTTTDTWSQGAIIPDPVWVDATAGATTGVMAPKRIHVMGGDESFDEPSSKNCAYDPQTDTWSFGAPLPTPRYSAAVAVVNDLIYVIGGGIGGYMTTTTVEQYTPLGYKVENSWTTMAPMPTARSSFGVAVVSGRIYAIGGSNRAISSSWSLGTNEEYNPATDKWVTKKPMPTPRYGFGIAAFQNKIYVIGGIIGQNTSDGVQLTHTGVNEVYDPLTDTWETKTPMPTKRARLNSQVVNGKIYLIGGETGGAYSRVDLTEVYDPVTDTWTQKTPLPTAVSDYASAVVDDKIHVIGGIGINMWVNLTQVYTPETDTWNYAADIPTDTDATPYSAGGATTGAFAPKRVYVVGGGSYFTSKANMVYDPDKNAWSYGASMSTARNLLSVAMIDDVLYAIGGSTNYLGIPTAAVEQYTPIGYGTVPPTIFVISPDNKTYTASDIPLTFILNKPTSWVGYSLNGQGNVAIAGNTTLTGLADGTHNIIVYARDTAGNMGASETIYFTIETAPSEMTFPPDPMGIPLAIAAITAGAVIIAFSVVAYRRKRSASAITSERTRFVLILPCCPW